MRTPQPHEIRRVLARIPRTRRLISPVRIPSRVWDERLAVLASALSQPGRAADSSALDAVRWSLRDADPAAVWLALAVLSGRLPEAEQVSDAHRGLDARGPDAVLDAARDLATVASVARRVTVVTDRTVVDMGDLVRYPLGTGIQRVVRMVGRSWLGVHDYLAVGWTDEMDAMYLLDDAERDAALQLRPLRDAGSPPIPTVVVPWRSTYVLPELATQPRRCLSLGGLARMSGNRCSVIGHDCVPLTSPETAAEGFPAHFALNLAAVAYFDSVVTVSEASATEYGGWRQMLAGAGLTGPRVVALPLPVSVPAPSAAAMEAGRARFIVGDMPMVLCVGSHEPRKNHLAVLAAAERLWRDGLHFTLVMVGGRSWGSDEFTDLLTELQAKDRPVELASNLDDAALWAAYRLARLTVFPSLSEGFGLPVAESIAAGTPVVTSNYGSMQEIAAGGGAVLVDPRSDDSVMAGIRSLLEDDELYTELVAACRRRQLRTWGQYSADLWGLAHDSVPLRTDRSALAHT